MEGRFGRHLRRCVDGLLVQLLFGCFIALVRIYEPFVLFLCDAVATADETVYTF